MVRCNNLRASQEKEALDINILQAGPVCERLCLCVCVHICVCEISFMTGTLAHQRDGLFFCSPQNQTFFYHIFKG